MRSRPFLLSLALLTLTYVSFGQSSLNSKINTTGAEAYFKVVNLLKAGKEPQWQDLFHTPIYQMMIAGNAIDTAVLKSEMRHVFTDGTILSQESLPDAEKYHQLYKANQEQLEKYIQLLRSSSVVDSIKALLYPFLPKRLQTDSRFPTLFYVNYEKPEATGFGGIVINDLFHSYKIDNYKFGLLAAHEAFHAIVSVAFQQALKPNIDYNAADFNLLYFLDNVAEEGIADLIDKPLLLKTGSPVYQEVKELTSNDQELSIRFIRSIDSLLHLAAASDQVLQQFNGFSDIATKFGKNGGHIPGRFMATVINNAGLLPKHLTAVEDPVSFFLTYNEAVKKNAKKYPAFSKESLAYLKQLKAKYWNE